MPSLLPLGPAATAGPARPTGIPSLCGSTKLPCGSVESRRTALLATALVLRRCWRLSKPSRREVFIWPLLMCGPPARAEVTLADVSKGIMGGDRDVYYPSWFLGEWEATTELVSVEFPQGEQMADKDALRQSQLLGTKQAVEQYPQKYIEYDGKIIADRGYNMRNYVRGSGGGPRALESVEWDPKSPNLSSVTLKRNGLSIKTETRIKKRTVGVPEGRDDLFNSSEVFLQEVSGSSEGDKITPIRCVNKFKKKDSEILVIQRLEIFPRYDGNNPETLNLEKPSVIYKYKGFGFWKKGGLHLIECCAAIYHYEHRLKKSDPRLLFWLLVPQAPQAQLVHLCCVRFKTTRLTRRGSWGWVMTSAKEMSAAPYRPGELLSKAMTQETSDAQIPTNSAASFDMKGHKAAAEAHCEVDGSERVSPDERDDDDDDDDDDYSDSEDAYEDGQRPVPPGKVDGQQLNVGSTGHHLRLCKPCAFWNTKGCKDGKACKFCHLCEPGEKKRRKKEKSAYIRNISRWRQTDPPPPAAPPTRPPPGPPGPPIGGPGPSLAPRR
ncbi:unnamed protein product [Cladocopium goreaui]|uniref:C3H1-type domain-containing protein n=1 Tax=Cladocopium goreaui TaxID=2562237 RepID=A0A9P1M691_9DINO|nr:unnamed protein product [Cladocopium goreaui]